MDYNKLNHIQQLQHYQELLNKHQFLHFRQLQKNKKVLKLTSLQDLELTFKQIVEIVLQFIDLLLISSLQHQTLQISNKLASTKGNAFYYYLMGSPKKVGFKMIDEKEWLVELLQFQKKLNLAKRTQTLQFEQQEEWNEWLSRLQTAEYQAKIQTYQSFSRQIHSLICNFADTPLNSKYNSKIRILKYLLSTRVSYIGMKQLLLINQKAVVKQSAQIIYKSKVYEVGQILKELSKERIISNLKISNIVKDKPEEGNQVPSNFTAHTNENNLFTFLISIGEKRQEFDSQVNLQEKEVDKGVLIRWANSWVRGEIEVDFTQLQIFIVIRTLPFWKIYSNKFVQISNALLSSHEQIVKTLLSSTRQAYFFDPTRLAFRRWTKKLETGLCLEEQIRITGKNLSVCELLLCGLDRQMLIWSSFERELQESSREWGEKPSQKYELNQHYLRRKINNGYNCYLSIKSLENNPIK